MVKLDIIFNKYTDVIPYPIFGFLSILIGYLGDIIAILLFPGYDLTYMISALGIGPGAIYFNGGMIISGIFAFIFYVNFTRVLREECREYKKLFKFARITVLNSCVFFILIGFFPGIPSNTVLFNLHGFCAMISWFSAIAYLSSFAFLFMKIQSLNSIYSYFAIAAVGSIIIFLLTWIPIIEWVMTIILSLWIILIAVYMMIRK
jgi:hypothetical protein